MKRRGTSKETEKRNERRRGNGEKEEKGKKKFRQGPELNQSERE